MRLHKKKITANKALTAAIPGASNSSMAETVVPLNVVCGLLYREGRILAAQRGEGRALASFWEFPGGKLENGESPEEALLRELCEELGIDAHILAPLPEVLYSDAPQPIRLLPFLCGLAAHAQPEAREHAGLAWVDAATATVLEWAPADRPLVESLGSLLNQAATLSARLHSMKGPALIPSMSDHTTFQRELKTIWNKATEQYANGMRDSARYFSDEEAAFLNGIGHSAQEVYDFAEDWVRSGEPDFETFLLIAAQRRHYFLNHMGGTRSGSMIDTVDLPPKTEAVEGIEWLPRIIPKARAKLRGEMSPDLMYGCGGDRRFFKEHQIHPAEFLAIVMDHFDDDKAIIDFVVRRSKTAARS